MDMARNIKVSEILQTFEALFSGSLGDLKQEVNHFATTSTARVGSLGFVNSVRSLKDAEASALTCVIAPSPLQESVSALKSDKTWLFSPNVDLAACEVKKCFVFPTPYRPPMTGVHPTAVVDPTAELGLGVCVGPHAVIGRQVRIGEATSIGASAVIEENCHIKSHVTIHPLAYLGHSTEVGHYCEIMPQAIVGSEGFGYAHNAKGEHFRIPHTGRVILEDHVHVGAGTAIDRGTIEDTRVGAGTKLDNQVHLAHNTQIGKNGLITAKLVTAGSSKIGDNFVCGGMTAVAGHIEVTDNVNVAGLSAIANDVKEPGQYGGYPLVPLKHHLKVRASTVHLPEFRKQLNRVLRKLFPEDFS
jgi:UDP-3-O-[3-hydroxymyristoyl] glucosamine N-acyltransferase